MENKSLQIITFFWIKPFLTLLLFMGLLSQQVCSQSINVIPYPLSSQTYKGNIAIGGNVAFYNANGRYNHLINYLNSRLTLTNNKHAPLQRLLLNLNITKGAGSQTAYVLNTRGKNITITSGCDEGLFYGMVTLLQIMQSGQSIHNQIIIPHVVIKDKPRYAWRGFMLDESRHFFGKAEVERLIDWMAFYKLNRLHWHLTDANGWRIEIKKYPLLATIGGIGNVSNLLAPACYYTQAEIKDIVQYAKERYITIIPEIDMPGHATAAVKAYPQLSGGDVKDYPGFTFNPGKEFTYSFITNVLKEVHALFPSQMIHIGGDEVVLGIKAWENNADVQALMNKEGLKTLTSVEKYFMKRVADSVSKFSTKILCWDESAGSGLDTQKTMINWWRHNNPGSLKESLAKRYEVILCPRLPLYFDFVQDSTHVSGRKWNAQYCSIWDVYHFPENSPDKAMLSNAKIIGLQANLWTETVVSSKRLNYLIFPRIAGLAEAAWTEPALKNDESFKQRLKLNLALYQKSNIYYYDPFNPQFHPEPVDIKAYKVKPD
jgi:hexosaminidase